MQFLEEMKLNDLKVLDRHEKIQTGKLFQTGLNSKLVVGVKTPFVASNGTSEKVLLLSDENFGDLVDVENLQGPIIDIDGLAKIVAVSPGLVPFVAEQSRRKGSIYKLQPYADAYVVWAVYVSDPRITLWVCISSGDPQISVGSSFSALRPTSFTQIASSGRLRLIEKP